MAQNTTPAGAFTRSNHGIFGSAQAGRFTGCFHMISLPHSASCMSRSWRQRVTNPIQIKWSSFCNNINNYSYGPNWRAELIQAREQLPKYTDGIMPLAEILTQAQSGQLIDAVGKVHQLARAGHLRSAMDEAFEAFKFAPNLFTSHTLVGDLLIQEGHTQDAITKYAVVAQAYSARGEPAQAVSLFRRIVQVAPMDLRPLPAYRPALPPMARWMMPLANTWTWRIFITVWLNWIWLAKTCTTALRLAQKRRRQPDLECQAPAANG